MDGVGDKMNLDESNFRRAEAFATYYDLERTIKDSKEKSYLGNLSDPRRCRFCHKEEPEVTFISDAHVIPQFMGNRKLLSYFECDACNLLFSNYESSFANYLGAYRTFAQIPGQQKTVPDFRDKKNGVNVSIGEDAVYIETHGNDEAVTFDTENHKFHFSAVRKSYIPIHILKILIKIGLCMLPENDLVNYETARKFIMQQDNDHRVKGNSSFLVLGYFIPGPPLYFTPVVQLFKRKEAYQKALIPERQVVFYYANYCLQMMLPYSATDKHLLGEKNTMNVFPLLVDNNHFKKYGPYQQLQLDFTSNEKVIGELMPLTFSFESGEKLPPDENESPA